MKLSALSSTLAIGVLLTAGCGIRPETLDSVREAIRTASATAAATQTAVEDPSSAETAAVAIEFQPPHPERLDPFTLPSSEPPAAAPGRPVATAVAITVLGFADVDGPRVLLSVQGHTVSLAVGESIQGVQVVGIHPPAVDLRRGSQQWRATMFDRSAVGRH